MDKKQKDQLLKLLAQVPVETSKYYCFLSVSNGKERARVELIRKDTLDACLTEIEERMKKKAYAMVRVDMVRTMVEHTYHELMKKLSFVSRNNYFRLGIGFDKKLAVSFLAEELQGNALLKPSKDHVVGFNSPQLQFDEKNLKGYMMRKYGQVSTKKLAQHKFYVFDTQAVYLDRGHWVPLSSEGETKGLRTTDTQTLPYRIHEAIEQGEEFLRKQLNETGQFRYGYYPTYDYELTGYNTVRHFSSIYALLEAQESLRVTNEYTELAKKALDWGLQELSMEVDGALYLKEESATGTELKLGAQALAILAFAKYQEMTGDSRYEKTIGKIIQGISTAFLTAEGDTIHILDEHLQVKKKFNIIYYDGEAVFGVLRGYALTQDAVHLALAKQLFDRFIEKNYERYHDHWLSYATNELLHYSDDKKYYEFGLKNAFENLSFIEYRDTAYPTMLELLMAAIKMVDKLKQTPYVHTHTLSYPFTKEKEWQLKEVARKRAEVEVEKGVMVPELAMFMKCPEKIVHGFYTRHDKFRMRIDDQEHFLSGLVNYYDYFYEEKSGEEK